MVESINSNERIMGVISNEHLMNAKASERMLRSKYGMLEIFRSAFSRRDAILLMRRLNRKFNAMSKDKHLRYFTQNTVEVVKDIRKEQHLSVFENMVTYTNLIQDH